MENSFENSFENSYEVKIEEKKLHSKYNKKIVNWDDVKFWVSSFTAKNSKPSSFVFITVKSLSVI